MEIERKGKSDWERENYIQSYKDQSRNAKTEIQRKRDRKAETHKDIDTDNKKETNRHKETNKQRMIKEGR